MFGGSIGVVVEFSGDTSGVIGAVPVSVDWESGDRQADRRMGATSTR